MVWECRSAGYLSGSSALLTTQRGLLVVKYLMCYQGLGSEKWKWVNYNLWSDPEGPVFALPFPMPDTRAFLNAYNTKQNLKASFKFLLVFCPCLCDICIFTCVWVRVHVKARSLHLVSSPPRLTFEAESKFASKACLFEGWVGQCLAMLLSPVS